MPTETLLAGSLTQINEAVKEEARDVVTQLRDFEPSFLCIHTAGGETRLPAELAQFLLAVTANVANGSVIGVQTLPEELTTTTAAQQLSVSRPTLMKMIHSGEIESYKVGTHTRIKAEELMRFRDARRERRQRALAQLLEIDSEYSATE